MVLLKTTYKAVNKKQKNKNKKSKNKTRKISIERIRSRF